MSQLYLCNGDAETAHHPKLILFLSEMQKMRIFKKYFVSTGDAEDAHLGWRENPDLL